MHYLTLTSVITFLLLMLVLVLFIYPTATAFMLASALTPLLIGILAFRVLRAPVHAPERKTDSDWYDVH